MAPPFLQLVHPRSSHEESPFDALLEAVEHDSAAAQGLALGYAAFPRNEREALIRTVIADTQVRGRSAAAPLAVLLAVEEDPRLARVIALSLTERAGGRTWGSEHDGGIAIVRDLYGAAREVLCLRWRDGELEDVSVAPLAQDERFDEICSRLGVPDAADRIGLDSAVDRLAEQLWRIRRARGSLPGHLHALAHIFVPY